MWVFSSTTHFFPNNQTSCNYLCSFKSDYKGVASPILQKKQKQFSIQVRSSTSRCVWMCERKQSTFRAHKLYLMVFIRKVVIYCKWWPWDTIECSETVFLTCLYWYPAMQKVFPFYLPRCWNICLWDLCLFTVTDPLKPRLTLKALNVKNLIFWIFTIEPHPLIPSLVTF